MAKIISGEIERMYEVLIQELDSRQSGQRLGSFAKLQTKHGCSRRVLEHALQRLVTERLVEVKPKNGIFVRSRRNPSEHRVVVVHADWPAEYWQVLDDKLERAFQAMPGFRFSRMYLPPAIADRPWLSMNRTTGDLFLLTYSFHHCTQEETARLLGCGVPIVFLENHMVCDALNTIDSEPEYTGMLAAEYLLRNGHRKLAVIISETMDHCVRRELNGFLRYAQLHGVTPQWIDCRHGDRESSLGATEEAFQRYLRQNGATFTACFVLSVFSADGVYRAARALGYSIPDDFSVIANTEVPSAARFAPPLTTVARDIDGYAREICTGAKQLFQGRPFGIHRVPSHLIKRSSVRNLTSPHQNQTERTPDDETTKTSPFHAD